MNPEKKKQRAKDKQRQQNLNRSKNQQQELEQPKDLQQEPKQPKNPQQESQNKEGQPEIQTKVASTVEELLAQIHQAIKGDNYIFRGENKNHGKISSKLYRYFQIIASQAALQEIVPEPNLDFITQTLKKQLGEFAQSISFPALENSIKENILAQLAQKGDHSLMVEDIQKNLILKDVQEHVDFENEIDTLAELQHYGGSTNRIDFSYDIAVALFFACDGELEENGRLILLRADDEGVISPKKNQNNRIVFQKSVFVKRDDGYVEEKDIKKIIVPKNLKPLILTYVQNYFGIKTETIYGDLMGYIQNQERHSEAYKHFFAASIYGYDKNFAEEINCYKKAIKLKPNFTEAYFNRGVVYGKEGKHDIAIIDYTKVIELNSKYTKAYNNRGNSYDKKGEYDLAIADYNEAIALNSDAMIYVNRGIAYSNKGEHDLAIADHTKAINMDPNYIKAYNNRGISYNSKGEHDLAIADHTKAINMDPNYTVAYNNRGVAYSSKGDDSLAIVDFNKSIELDPNDAKAYNGRGNTYYSKGDNALAIVDYTKAIELNPNYAEAYANRGIAKRNLRKEGAKEDLETALQLAKEQENESIVNDIQKKIDELLDDSDS